MIGADVGWNAAKLGVIGSCATARAKAVSFITFCWQEV